MFYMASTQEVILFVLETLVLLVAMERMVEGTHTGFLSQITGKRVRRKSDGTWVTTRAQVVQEAAATK